MTLSSLARAGRQASLSSVRCAVGPAASLFSSRGTGGPAAILSYSRGAGGPAASSSIRGAGGPANVHFIRTSGFTTSTKKTYFTEERYEKVKETLIGASALVGAVTTLGGSVYWAGKGSGGASIHTMGSECSCKNNGCTPVHPSTLVAPSMGKGVVKYLEESQRQNLAAIRAEISSLREELLTSIKEETSCREDFQKRATYAHQDLIRRTDSMNSDLRADMIKQQQKGLQFEQGTIFYRDQVVKAEEAIKKAGGLKRDTDQFLHLVKKISDVDAKLDAYTAEHSSNEELKAIFPSLLTTVDEMKNDIVNLKENIAAVQGTGGSA